MESGDIIENETTRPVDTFPNGTSMMNLTDLAPPVDLPPKEGVLQTSIIVPLYAIIFVLSITGNTLVLVTLGKRIKVKYNVTNVFLINLAASDLLLGVFCMPFTLIGQVLRNFIFGSLMCSLIPYFQAVSVSVGVWTLVVISLERYYAICRPLESRTWQTPGHAYKILGIVWFISLTWTSPIIVYSQLRPLSGGRYKCREAWPNDISEKIYNIFLDIVLLLIPVTVMALAYCLIVGKLWRGLQTEVMLSRAECSGAFEGRVIDQDTQGGSARRSTLRTWLAKIGLATDETASSTEIALEVLSSSPRSGEGQQEGAVPSTARRYEYPMHAIRSTYTEKSIEAKRKVIRMLFVVVAEFFVCWAPLHVLNTWYLFAPDDVYKYVGANGISLIQLLAYVSSCCNPITYCFMNKKFRQAFFSVFTCCQALARTCGEEEIVQRPVTVRVQTTTDMSGNETTLIAAVRPATHHQSDDMDLEAIEAEDIV